MRSLEVSDFFCVVKPGRVKVSQKGFASAVQEDVTVNVDQTTELNITMRVGSATETVTVTRTSNLVDPGNSTVRSLIKAPTIDRVPLLYRNVGFYRTEPQGPPRVLTVFKSSEWERRGNT